MLSSIELIDHWTLVIFIPHICRSFDFNWTKWGTARFGPHNQIWTSTLEKYHVEGGHYFRHVHASFLRREFASFHIFTSYPLLCKFLLRINLFNILSVISRISFFTNFVGKTFQVLTNQPRKKKSPLLPFGYFACNLRYFLWKWLCTGKITFSCRKIAFLFI